MPGNCLYGDHRRQDVAAGGDLDAVALQVEVGDLERVAGAGPDDPDHLAAGLVLQRVDHALGAGGEVGGRRRQVFLVDDLGLLERVLERLHAVAAERVVLRQRGDRDAVLVERDRVGDRVLRAVAAGAEDVLVPLVAGDRSRRPRARPAGSSCTPRRPAASPARRPTTSGRPRGRPCRRRRRWRAGSCRRRACPGRPSRSRRSSCRRPSSCRRWRSRGPSSGRSASACRRPRAGRSCCRRGRCGSRPCPARAPSGEASAASAATASSERRPPLSVKSVKKDMAEAP